MIALFLSHLTCKIRTVLWSTVRSQFDALQQRSKTIRSKTKPPFLLLSVAESSPNNKRKGNYRKPQLLLNSGHQSNILWMAAWQCWKHWTSLNWRTAQPIGEHDVQFSPGRQRRFPMELKWRACKWYVAKDSPRQTCTTIEQMSWTLMFSDVPAHTQLKQQWLRNDSWATQQFSGDLLHSVGTPEFRSAHKFHGFPSTHDNYLLAPDSKFDNCASLFPTTVFPFNK